MRLDGKNSDGERVFSYIKLSLLQLRAMKEVIIKREEFAPSDYGEILVQGLGSPSEEVVEAMTQKYGTGMMNQLDNPNNASVPSEFMEGYKIAYLELVGSNLPLPTISLPIKLPEHGTLLQEGIRQGIRAAKEYLLNRGQ